MLLAEKVAVITGAGSGVGRATALVFASEGARVVLGDLRADWGEETLALIRKAGDEAQFRACDVRIEADVAGLIENAVRAFGRLDIIFNNAGVSSARARSFEDYEDGDWERIIDVNLRGVFYGCKHAVRQFKKQGGGGVILNTASISGLVGLGGTVYCTSKGGVVQLTRALAMEVASHNIRVNSLCPGGMPTQFGGAGSGLDVHTPEDVAVRTARQSGMHPLGRAIDPEDVANAALYLASDLAKNVTGIALPIDGGFTAQ